MLALDDLGKSQNRKNSEQEWEKFSIVKVLGCNPAEAAGRDRAVHLGDQDHVVVRPPEPLSEMIVFYIDNLMRKEIN